MQNPPEISLGYGLAGPALAPESPGGRDVGALRSPFPEGAERDAGARFRVPDNLLRPSKARPDPRRLAYAHALADIAKVVANGRTHHGATLKALALALRGAGWSAGKVAKRWGVTPRQVREWTEPGGTTVPTAKRTVRRIVAHARQLAGVEGTSMFGPGSMAALLEAAVSAEEAQRRESAPGWVAGPSDVADAAERAWPACRGLLASKSRTGFLSSVRLAVMQVLEARGFAHDIIGDQVGRERSTVSHRVGT